MPKRVTWPNGNWVELAYDANGTKLKKTTSAGAVKHYINGIEYSGSTIEAVYHAEGRASLQSGTYRYEYTLRDHLGNSRVMFADLNGDNEVTEAEILQQNHYYPFGMNMEGSWAGGTNRYQYNGIERVEDSSLDWDVAEFRSYDSAIGRWIQVDPLAEIAPELTPYRNAFNNPFSYIDPFGLFETKKEAREYRRQMRREARERGEKYSGGRIVKNEEGRYDLRSKDSDGYVTRNSEGSLEFGVVARDPNAIRERQPNGWERLYFTPIGFVHLKFKQSSKASVFVEVLKFYRDFDLHKTYWRRV